MNIGEVHPPGCTCAAHIKPLSKLDNGYPVVARCEYCAVSLTLRNDHHGGPYLVHVHSLERRCPIFYFAKADRPVPELGLLDESNAE